MKKVSFWTLVILFCLLFLNTENQFAAVKSEEKSRTSTEKQLIKRNGKVSVRKNTKFISYKSKINNQNNLWQQISEESLRSQEISLIAPAKYKVFQLNNKILTKILSEIPSESKKVTA